jgi:hypothetical protein
MGEGNGKITANVRRGAIVSDHLQNAWKRYRALVGLDPHGTEKLLKAMFCLTERY